MKTILTHMTGTACDRPVLATAMQIARIFSSHLECLRIVADPAYLAMAQLDMASAAMIADAMRALDEKQREQTKLAHENLAAFCKAYEIANADEPPGPNSISAHWSEKTGDEFDELTAAARFHDLTVLAGGKERPGRLPPEGIGQIVVGSGRPILLAPEQPRESATKTIAIAWKNTPEAARALTAAMPLLAKAERIDVLSANEDDAQSKKCLECGDRVVRFLRWHGLNAYGHFVIPAGRTVPNAILDSAHGFNADLLVMGGYGHSRLREFIFGGFTQRILDGVGLPVLLFH